MKNGAAAATYGDSILSLQFISYWRGYELGVWLSLRD